MSAPKHAPQTNFKVVDGELVVGGFKISELAARVGRTPFFAYDRAVMRAGVERLRAVLPQEISLHYAMKANPMPALVAYMAQWVDGLDVASGLELRVALDSGMRPKDISFAGPGKTAVELDQAVAAGILLNIESRREVRLLREIVQRQGKSARVAVRINPDFELKSSGMKMGGGPKQFGIDAEQVAQVLAEIRNSELSFEGFHIFSGSQNLRAESICDAQTKALDLAVRLSSHAPSPIKVLNLGGGFGIPYFPGETPLEVEPIGAHLHGIVERAKVELPGVELVIELGRYLVGQAGVYVCKVLDRKESRGEIFLVTDGGLHHQLAASGNFGQVIRKNYPAAIGNRMQGGTVERVSIVGCLCTPLDLLADRTEVQRADEGDLVVIFQSGAYGATASPINFLSHPHPVEVLV
jgi:diaminopimelate decarboxylase